MKMTIIFITLVPAQTDLRQQHCLCLCLGTTQCCKTGFQIGTERDTHKTVKKYKVGRSIPGRAGFDYKLPNFHPYAILIFRVG